MMAKVPNFSNNVGEKKIKTNINKEYYEDKKTVIRNTSKNIYKPSFNLPAKESYEEPVKENKKKLIDKRPDSTAGSKKDRAKP